MDRSYAAVVERVRIGAVLDEVDDDLPLRQRVSPARLPSAA